MRHSKEIYENKIVNELKILLYAIIFFLIFYKNEKNYPIFKASILQINF